MGRTAAGVKAITLRKDDIAVCMDIAVPEEELLIVSQNGFGKRTAISEYTLQRRGGKGLITYKETEKTGKIAGARVVKEDDELMIINNGGVAIRIYVSNVSTTSRNAMGVKLMRTSEEENVVAIAKINSNDDLKESLDDVDDDVNDITEFETDEINGDTEEEIVDAEVIDENETNE